MRKKMKNKVCSLEDRLRNLGKEGKNLEFKSSWSDDCLKVISAYANSNGGVLAVGIDDNGKINLVSRQTASRDLKEMVDFNILLKHGETGRDAHYTLAGKTADRNNASQTPQTPNERLTNASEERTGGTKETQ